MGPLDPAIVTKTSPGANNNEFFDETDLISPTRPEQPLFSSVPPSPPVRFFTSAAFCIKRRLIFTTFTTKNMLSGHLFIL